MMLVRPRTIALGAALLLLAVALDLRAQPPPNPLRLGRTSLPSTITSPNSAATRRGAQRDYSDFEIWGEETPQQPSAVELAQALEQLPAPPYLLQDGGKPPVAPVSPQIQPAPPINLGWPQTPSSQVGDEAGEFPAEPGQSPFGAHLGGHESLVQPWFGHMDPNDPDRHRGMGQPLRGTSWLNRPWFAGLFIGGIFNGDLIHNHVRQNGATLLGGRIGWDFDHFWGVEARYGFANPNISNVAGRPLAHSRNYLVDASLVYYPWGDSRWRPYVSGGLGAATFRFNDDQGRRVDDSLLSVPLGVGLKYFYSPTFTMRIDLTNNIAVGSRSVNGMDNVSIMGGGEFRFGGRRPSYYPWHGDTRGW